jgi:hypothetical protein
VTLLVSCIKELKNSGITEKSPVPKQTSHARYDTIPDGGCLRIKIQKDSFSTDETMLVFDHTASAMYINTQDAVYFPGYGDVSLSSLSNDGMPCVIQKLPYIQCNPIGLNVNVKSNGIYYLKLSYLNKVPQTIGFWLKDKYMKDSLDLRVGTYAFQVIKSDTNTFGRERFKIVLR